MLVLCMGAALAAETITLPEVEPLPSALDDTSAVDSDELGLDDLVDLARARRGAPWSGRSIARPLLSVRLDDAGGHPLQLGAAVGRQWWQLREGPKAAAEAVLTGEATLGSGAGSYHADLTVVGGANVGPLGVRVGPSVVVDRTVLGDLDLGRVFALAPVASLTLDLRVVQLGAAAMPRFFVAGDRAGAGLGLGDEPVVRGGLAVTPNRLRISADWTGRWTTAGRVDRLGLGLHFRL